MFFGILVAVFGDVLPKEVVKQTREFLHANYFFSSSKLSISPYNFMVDVILCLHVDFIFVILKTEFCEQPITSKKN